MKNNKEEQTKSLQETVVMQGLLLADNELLVYKDESGDFHVLTTKPYNKDKQYSTLFMTWEDLQKVG